MSNEPIIKPIWLYLVDVAYKFGMVNMLVCGICLLSLLGITLWYFIENSWKREEEEKKCKRICKVLVIITLITGLLVSFIPSQKTMYSMLATNYVTPANIQYVGETAEDCIDYIFDKVEDLLEDGENNE